MSRRSPVVPAGPAALPGVPGSVGVPWLGDRSVEFYRDPVRFVESRIQSHRGRVFSSRVLNTPTVFLCSVQGMKELLCEKSSVFVKDPKDIMTNMYGDTLVTTNGEEACLLRLSLSSLFTGSCLDSWNDYITRVCERCLKDLSVSGHPDSVYSVFKGLGTELVLGLFLNVRSEHQPELYQEITQLCTQHWHGLISAPVSVKVPLWSSGFCTALEARDRLMDIIRDRLDKDTHGFVGSLGSLPLPGPSCASQHLLLFISALIPKALASLLTSFTLALSGPHMEESRRRAREEPNFLHNILLEVQRLWPPFIGGRRIANQDSSLTGFHVPKGFAAMYISHSVHRDPEVFLQPDHFLPDRWSGRNQGQEHVLCCLGNGPRNCIGTQLNEVFLKAACIYLLKHYDWCLDPPSQDLQYKWLPVCRPSNPPTVSFTKLDHNTPDHNSSSSPDHNSSSSPDHNSSSSPDHNSSSSPDHNSSSSPDHNSSSSPDHNSSHS